MKKQKLKKIFFIYIYCVKSGANTQPVTQRMQHQKVDYSNHFYYFEVIESKCFRWHAMKQKIQQQTFPMGQSY